MLSFLRRLHEDEAGHMAPAGLSLLGIVAAVALAWGIIGDIDWLVIVGAIALGLAAQAGGPLTHREVDYAVFERLGRLEAGPDADGDD
jgi:hypothetical protein